MKQEVQILLVIILMFITTSTILVWSVRHDEQVMVSAEKYEKCIMEQAYMTPSAYYAVNGKYPECLK